MITLTIHPANAIFLVIGIIIVFIFLVGNDKQTEYKIWFEDLKKMAPSYGFTYKDIEDFTEDEFRGYFEQGMGVEIALRHHLSEE